MDIIKRIDYFGAFLRIGGITLFLVGLQGGGYQYPWVRVSEYKPSLRHGDTAPCQSQTLMAYILTWN